MTCIVAITAGSRIVMGSDSGSADLQSREKYVVETPKVFRAGEKEEYLVGFAGSWRLGQVLAYEMRWPEIPKGFDREFVVKRLVPDLRDCLRDQPDYKDPRGMGNREWIIIVGAKGKIFGIGYSYDVVSLEREYLAIGGGRLVAYGSLSSTRDLGLEPEERIHRALTAACELVPGIEPPFRVLSSEF